jgi:hypothetical protein
MAISTPSAEEHIAACGLFCTNCGKFKKGKCQGCQITPGFQRCSIRKCVIEKGITTCAECDEFASPRSYAECKKINNLMAKVFALIFRSNRPAALALLRDEGREAYLQVKRTDGKM